MRGLILGRFALAIGVAAALSAGCSASQSPIATGTQGAVYPQRAGSTTSGDLLYVTADGTSYVLTYPQGQVVGTINSGASGACSDAQGDVYLTGGLIVAEFAHGATTPSRTVDRSGTVSGLCRRLRERGPCRNLF
jgi:hypothetical protein